MLKQSASRNQRWASSSSSKSLKLKRALQIFVLVAVGIWLLHKAKHRRPYHSDKDAVLEEKPASSGIGEDDRQHQILKIGRKELMPQLEDEIAEKPGDEEVELEDEESKAEEDGSEEMDKERGEEAENDQFPDEIDEEDKDR